MPSTIAHGSGGTLLHMPLPGPVGVPGWKVSRRGYPLQVRQRHGVSHSRWKPAALHGGAVTLDFRVHKGARVPPREDVDYMGLQRLQAPQSQQLKALAFVRYLQEQTARGGRRGAAAVPTETRRDHACFARQWASSVAVGTASELSDTVQWSRAAEDAAKMPASAAAVRRPTVRLGSTLTAHSASMAVNVGTHAARGSDAALAVSPREALAASAAGRAALRQRPSVARRMGDQASMRCHASASVFSPVRCRAACPLHPSTPPA